MLNNSDLRICYIEDKIYGNLLNLYNKLLDEENRFVKQESSISTMIERHSKILELSSEMNNTSKEIFEFMKLYLIQSTIDKYFDNNFLLQAEPNK